MALITCPECGNEVSDRAEACPKCAYPLTASSHTTVENTKKIHKKNYILAHLIFFTGVLFLYIGFDAEQEKMSFIGFIGLALFIVGAYLYFKTKIKIWWDHS